MTLVSPNPNTIPLNTFPARPSPRGRPGSQKMRSLSGSASFKSQNENSESPANTHTSVSPPLVASLESQDHTHTSVPHTDSISTQPAGNVLKPSWQQWVRDNSESDSDHEQSMESPRIPAPPLLSAMKGSYSSDQIAVADPLLQSTESTGNRDRGNSTLSEQQSKLIEEKGESYSLKSSFGCL